METLSPARIESPINTDKCKKEVDKLNLLTVKQHIEESLVKPFSLLRCRN